MKAAFELQSSRVFEKRSERNAAKVFLTITFYMREICCRFERAHYPPPDLSQGLDPPPLII